MVMAPGSAFDGTIAMRRNVRIQSRYNDVA